MDRDFQQLLFLFWFLGILQIFLVILRLANFIEWHWAIVLIPIWTELLLLSVITIVLIIWIKKDKKTIDKQED